MDKLSNYLPKALMDEISSYEYVNEIRLKRDTSACVRVDGSNHILSYKMNSESFDHTLDRLLGHSYHSQLPNMTEGYITLGDGYRVGVCGRAVLRDGRITNISDIISVVIRIPRAVHSVSLPVCEYMQRMSFRRGVLIYSPPGVGKTTLLRDTAMTLAGEPYCRRIALIDARKELYVEEMKHYPLIDPYIGYPKAKGIELAIRTMAPDIIICDEIGNEEDTLAILNNQSAGVPIIASAHGSDFSALVMRQSIARLYHNAVFGCYMGITRRGNSDKYRFEIREEEEKYLVT